MNNDFVFKPKKTPPPPKPEEPVLEDSEAPSEDGHESVDLTSEEDSNIPTEDSPTPEEKPKGKGKKTRRSAKQWFLDLTKKQKILLGVSTVLFLAGLVVLGLVVFGGDKKVDAPAKKQAAVKKLEKPKTEASKLTGMQISPELNKRSITGIMIENSLDARPQAGLKDAGVVYEAIAEGGITRFLTLFQEGQPDYIGPVRSVRPYYLDWVQGFDAPIAHAGGSADALAKLRADGVKDLDQFANGSSYTRVNNREAPHNLYTSTAQMDALKTAKGFTTSTFTSLARKKEQPSKTPTAKTVDLVISSTDFNPHYDYDAKTNSYKRSEGGAPHTDERSGAQLSPKVVIALVMSQGRQGVYTTYNAIGSGACFIFQDGTVTEGTWVKANAKDQTTFKDARGADIKLNPGQTWISTVGSSGAVTYAP